MPEPARARGAAWLLTWSSLQFLMADWETVWAQFQTFVRDTIRPHRFTATAEECLRAANGSFHLHVYVELPQAVDTTFA